MEHTAKLAHGYEVTFKFVDGAMRMEWSPDVPAIRVRRHRGRFFAAYKSARDEFMQMVAAVIGGGVAVLDYDGKTIIDATCVAPPDVH